ncbi:hypothetical protein J1N35_029310 [Gossypium stocksii]|uniref:Uncharacterized protein n=1 Tax=Gossypium stocksii TaxID=47602 RepID=A0A9D3UXK7_9ROSI|nr:hypothetical protein J1N35_029310 [Gossypium stocksii]
MSWCSYTSSSGDLVNPLAEATEAQEKERESIIEPSVQQVVAKVESTYTRTSINTDYDPKFTDNVPIKELISVKACFKSPNVPMIAQHKRLKPTTIPSSLAKVATKARKEEATLLEK